MIYKNKNVRREYNNKNKKHDSVGCSIHQYSNNMVTIWNIDSENINNEEFSEKVYGFREICKVGLNVQNLIPDEVLFQINEDINRLFNEWCQTGELKVKDYTKEITLMEE